jgi:hypothetical protein
LANAITIVADLSVLPDQSGLRSDWAVYHLEIHAFRSALSRFFCFMMALLARPGEGHLASNEGVSAGVNRTRLGAGELTRDPLSSLEQKA